MIKINRAITNGYELQEEMKRYNREDNFTIAGLDLLVNFYQDQDYELDVIGLCMEWEEYNLAENWILEDYDYLLMGVDPEDHRTNDEKEILLDILSDIHVILRDGDIVMVSLV